MELKWFVYIAIGILAYAALSNFDNFKANWQDQTINSLKELPGKIINFFKSNTQSNEDEYVNYEKPIRTVEFECSTDEHCNYNIPECNNLCKCDTEKGSCYIGELGG